jgi:hypothetical protein
MLKNPLRAVQALLLGAVLTAASPLAQGAAIQRTFVKSDGVDNPACNLAAPCRTFAAAMAHTLSGGEVIVLDSAGYGTVVIAQPVSIIAPPGVYAGISVSAGDGIAVNGAGITVVLQGLSITGMGGNNGISFGQGAELHVINCSISNFSGTGILATASGGRLFVSDTTIRGGNFFGVLLSGTLTGVFDRVRVEGTLSGTGIYASGGASISVRESVASNNFLGGIWGAAAAGQTARVTVDSTIIADNSASGASTTATGAAGLATLDVIRSTMTRNSTGYGADVSATSPATAVMTVASSVLSENAFGGIAASGTGTTTAFASNNLIARNSSGGIIQLPSAVVRTRGNNSGEQATPTSGTVTVVPGF